MNPELDSAIDILLIIVIFFFAVVFFARIAITIHGFSQELDYINREIGRTSGGEQRYWKREKRRLWLSLLPFYRR